MYSIPHAAFISGVLACAAGCDIVDRKADATYWFWARLHGIQWYGNQEIRGLSQANVSSVNESDLDGVAQNFAILSAKHASIIAQLKALDSSGVDETVLDYRERVVNAHMALVEEYQAHASATQQRNISAVQQGQPRLKARLIEYVTLCNEADSIMSTLKQQYDRDFNYAERPE